MRISERMGPLGEDHPSFRHEALFYSGTDDFVRQAGAFVVAGVERGDPVLVAVDPVKTDLLRDLLGADADAVRFVDMGRVGLNPARIIPVWHEFIEAMGHDAKRPRGIGEPIWAGRTTDELVEAEQHEELLNVAFASGRPWWLLCPYDVDTLEPAVLARASGTHPFLSQEGAARPSHAYAGDTAGVASFSTPLAPPPRARHELAFDAATLDEVRRFITRRATAFHLDPARVSDLQLAVNELATNSVRHGRGSGIVRAWTAGKALICEVQDDGRLTEPLAGRRRPDPGQESGIGLWLVNQLCDLVQIRSTEAGTVVRVHVYRDDHAG